MFELVQQGPRLYSAPCVRVGGTLTMMSMVSTAAPPGVTRCGCLDATDIAARSGVQGMDSRDGRTPVREGGGDRARILMISLVDMLKWDGAGVHFTSLAKAFSRLGHVVSVVSPDSMGPLPEPRHASRVGSTAGFPRQSDDCGARKEWYWYARAVRALYSFRPGLYTRISRSTILALRTVMGLCLRKPDIVYVRVARGTLLACVIAKLMGFTVVAEINGFPMQHGVRKRFDMLWQVQLRLADHVVAVTDELANEVKSIRRCAARVHRVPNGVDCTLFYPRNRLDCRRMLGLETGRRLVVFVGHLAPWQGLDILVRAMGYIPDAGLLVLGDGPLRKDLETLARHIGARTRVEFLGSVRQDLVPLYIGAADVCVTLKTPVEQEVSPLKLYEYVACGRPVVASKSKGLDLVEQYACGLLVENSPSAVSRALDEVMSCTRYLENALKASREVATRFDWLRIAEKILSLVRGEGGL